MIRPGVPALVREPDLAVCVATGGTRLYANVLLTIGYIRPGTGGTHD